MERTKSAAAAKRKRESSFHRVVKQLLKNRVATIGFIIFVIEVIIILLAPVIAPYDPAALDMTAILQKPSAAHLMGTDSLGRDLFSRILWGGRYSIGMALAATAFGTIGGMIFGAICGFFGGKVDYLIMRFLDIVQAIPGTLLVIVIATVLGTGFTETIIALGISGIAGAARLLRASMLNIRQLEYVEASHSINCSKFRIIMQHLIRPDAFAA